MEVNRTNPSLSVRIPWSGHLCLHSLTKSRNPFKAYASKLPNPFIKLRCNCKVFGSRQQLTERKICRICQFNIFLFFSTHYDYIEETRQIRHTSLVILILGNTCNGHNTMDPENWEFILDSKNRINGISFKITERNKSETYYIVKNDFLKRVQFDLIYELEPFLYYDKDKFFQTYEISKEFDFNYITPYNFKRPIFFRRSAPPPSNKTAYLSIFCPVSYKEIQLSYRNKYEQTTTVKYGWTMFSICSKYYNDLSQKIPRPNRPGSSRRITRCRRVRCSVRCSFRWWLKGGKWVCLSPFIFFLQIVKNVGTSHLVN